MAGLSTVYPAKTIRLNVTEQPGITYEELTNMIFLLTFIFLYSLNIVLAKVYSRPTRLVIASAILALILLVFLPVLQRG